MKIPTLTEIYPVKKMEQQQKQQTTLLDAILRLQKTIENFDPNRGKSEARIQHLELELENLNEAVNGLTVENEHLNRELDDHEKLEAQLADHQREIEFQLERFKTLQEHYQQSTNYCKELQDKTKQQQTQIEWLEKDVKKWEAAAVEDRLKLNKALKELEVANIRLDKFKNLFQQVFE